MHILQVAAVFVSVAGYVIAAEHTGESPGGFGGGTSVGGGSITIAKYVSGGASEERAGSFRGGENFPPQQHNFTYHAGYKQGNVGVRQEQGDQIEAIGAYYGYPGLYRNVESVANAGGSKADIETNEPEVGENNPDDPSVTNEHEPAGQQDRLIRASGDRPEDYSGAGGSEGRSYAGGVKRFRGVRAAPGNARMNKRAQNRSRPLRSGMHMGGGTRGSSTGYRQRG